MAVVITTKNDGRPPTYDNSKYCGISSSVIRPSVRPPAPTAASIVGMSVHLTNLSVDETRSNDVIIRSLYCNLEAANITNFRCARGFVQRIR